MVVEAVGEAIAAGSFDKGTRCHLVANLTELGQLLMSSRTCMMGLLALRHIASVDQLSDQRKSKEIADFPFKKGDAFQ